MVWGGVIHKPSGHIFGIFDPVPLRGHIYQIKLMLQNGHLANPPPPSTVLVVYGLPHTFFVLFIGNVPQSTFFKVDRVQYRMSINPLAFF